MKTSSVLIPVLAAALAGTGGYFLGRRETPAQPAPAVTAGAAPAQEKSAPAPALPPPGAAPASVLLSPEIMMLLGKEPVTPDNAEAIAYRVMEEGDPVRRRTACFVLLDNMTAENAEAIRTGFRKISRATGRRHDSEWSYMLRRYGACRGVEGLKALMPTLTDLRPAVEGLAAEDPDKALAAVKEAGLDFNEVANAWLTGVSTKDPARAIKLALSGKHDYADGGAIVQQAINSVGVDKVSEAMQLALMDAREGVTATKVFESMFAQIGESVFHRNRTLRTPEKMLPWLEELKDARYLPSQFVSRAVAENIKKNPGRTLDFLDTMNAGRSSLRGTDKLYETLRDSPQTIADMNAETFARVIKYLPTNSSLLGYLATLVEKVSPERAAQLRDAVPEAVKSQKPTPG